ncbi:MAG: histidine--tRNA ligase [Armatimonadota bacterium]
MPEYSAPRGTKDILPSESIRWQYVESKFREICELYGYRELRTPTFEHTELFTRNLGTTTDVVSKEMYTFEDRGGRSITLRPEGTAPAIRAYVEHNLGSTLLVTKLYYIARVFRYERPQAGRYREHTQLGVEAIGSLDPALDAEVISLAYRFYLNIGITGFELLLNSIGCPVCRPRYREALVEFTRSRLESLCPTCQTRYESNPMRMFDCKLSQCKEVLQDAPIIIDYLGDECREHFENVQVYLRELDVKYTIDPRLVRGFDYYTKTAFEFISGQLGAQNAIGGGGRYDNLVEELGGPPTPAIGFGIGLERVMTVLDKLGAGPSTQPHIDVFIAGVGNEAHRTIVKLLDKFRSSNISAETDYAGRSLKSQMKLADKLGARFTVIIGEKEISTGSAILRDMASSQQKEIPLDRVLPAVSEALCKNEQSTAVKLA